MRRFVRHPTDIPIIVRAAHVHPGQTAGGSMTTVGEGGLSCMVDTLLEVGSQVDIEIPSVSPAYHGTGEVVWCRTKGKRFEIGVRFKDTEEAFKSRMVEQVCQIEHYKNWVLEREGRRLDGNQAAIEWIEKHASSFDVKR